MNIFNLNLGRKEKGKMPIPYYGKGGQFETVDLPKYKAEKQGGYTESFPSRETKFTPYSIYKEQPRERQKEKKKKKPFMKGLGKQPAFKKGKGEIFKKRKEKRSIIMDFWGGF